MASASSTATPKAIASAIILASAMSSAVVSASATLSPVALMPVSSKESSTAPASAVVSESAMVSAKVPASSIASPSALASEIVPRLCWGQCVNDSWGCPGWWHLPGTWGGSPECCICPKAVCAQGWARSPVQGEGVFWGLCA